ncbi:MAG: hypothetical protein CMJ76_04720 [Planctomycetaceae bacterium]|nr:hypothetical protein [Planctomycetaceae bacterium]|tara:strand:- start:1281 stop:2162 length:882 start_codon:yes stop_codon:yes gene_type:complete
MSDASQNVIGVIGVGLLGSALCQRLYKSGYSIIGYDIDPGQLDSLLRIEGQAAGSIAEVAETAAVIFLSLPDSTVSTTVCSEIATSAFSGLTVIDTTTGTPEDAVKNNLMLRQNDIHFMEATVAGSSSQVQEGAAVLMIGGDTQNFNRHSSLLHHISNDVFYAGEIGAGAKLKLIVNLAIGLNRAVLAESLALADAAGIPMQKALEVLKATPAYSSAMDIKGEKMIDQNFTPQARLQQHRKDVRLIRQFANQHLQGLPLTDLHAKLLDTAIEAGYGDLDNSVIYKVIRENLAS